MRVTWPVPSTDARRVLWQQTLGDDAPQLAGRLDETALRYRLGAGAIQDAAASARTVRDARGPSATLELGDIVEGIRGTIAERLGELASRMDIQQRWEDLVLPPETHDDVKALIARVKFAHQVYEKWGFKSKMPHFS